MNVLDAGDLARLDALRGELGAGDLVSPARWEALSSEREYFARALGIVPGNAKDHESFLLLRDDDVALTGPRWWFHALGLRHGTAHIMLLTPQGWFVAQRRSREKDDDPGALDVSVSGHLGLNDPLSGAWREMEEELGLAPSVPGMSPGIVDDALRFQFVYEVLDPARQNPPRHNLERRWVYLAYLTPEGMERLRFADGEVTSVVLCGPRELRELANRCAMGLTHAQPGELDIASGLLGTLPRWLVANHSHHDIDL